MAVALCRMYQPDVVLMDLHMSNMDGVEALGSAGNHREELDQQLHHEEIAQSKIAHNPELSSKG